MVFGRFRPAPDSSAPGDPARGGARRDRLATLFMSVFVGLMLLLTLGGCGSGSGGGDNDPIVEPPVAGITGRVLDSNNNGAAVAGATVAYGNIVTATDNNGNFSINAPAGVTANLTVVGPALGDGSAGYYNTGVVGAAQYNIAGNGFPVAPLSAGEQRNLGTILIFGQSGPPPPPTF